VREILQSAMNGNVIVRMSAYNFLEVYYDSYRELGEEKANQEFAAIEHHEDINIQWVR